MRNRRPFRPRRAGNTLVLFALLLWVFMALATLTIDLGLVRTTQRQMQSMTDEAAVEAVYNLNGAAEDRQLAAQTVLIMALNDTQSSDPQRFGAGPLIDLSGGIPVQDGFSASQLLTIDQGAKVYQPTLAINAANAANGDIVQGTYNPLLTTANPEATGYDRVDFPTSTTGDSILVRLRRSNEMLTGDSASSGPPIPYLFGRGTFLSAQAKGQGVTVRATSIAAARPALSAGPTLTAQGIPGVAPFGIELDSWQAWRALNPTATVLTTTASLTTGTISGNVTGQFTAPVTVVTSIGQVFAPLIAAPMTPLPLDRYVPLYNAAGRIVGFLHADDPTLKTGPTLAPDGTLTIPINLTVAAGNASTALPNTNPNPLAGLSPADLSSVFSFTASAVSSGSTDPLRAPALVR